MYAEFIMAVMCTRLNRSYSTILPKTGFIWQWASDQPYSKHTVDIIPNCTSKHRGIHIFVHGHCVVSQVVGNMKLLIYQLPHIGVETIHQWISMVLPWIVLKNKKQVHECKFTRKTNVTWHYTIFKLNLKINFNGLRKDVLISSDKAL